MNTNVILHLAPVANLMGIAFNLKDPNNLLGKSGS